MQTVHHRLLTSCVPLVFALCASSLTYAQTKQGKPSMPTTASTPASKPADAQLALPLFYKALAPLSKKDHASLAFPEMPSSYAFASKANLIPILITEVGRAEADYPVVLLPPVGPNPLSLAVLVGLDGTNRYVDSAGQWRQKTYIPAWIRRYPFFPVQVAEQAAPMLAIDPTYADLGRTGGAPLLDKDGKPTERLQKILDFNLAYQNDAKTTLAALEALMASGVLESGTLQRQTKQSKESQSFTGFLVVNEKKLMALPDEQIVKLHKAGALGLAYAQMFSMRNIAHLIE